MEIETTVRKWGNSLGIVIPKEFASDLQPEDKVHISIRKKPVTVVKDILGMFADIKTIDVAKELREINKELESRFTK